MGSPASRPRSGRCPQRVFSLADSGRRQEAFTLAQRELRGRLQPALTQMNREVYRRARESSVRGAYARLEEILAVEGRTLLVIIALTLAVGLVVSWAISRGLTRPIRDLTAAMAVVGSGKLDHPVTPTSRDEIGELAGAFGRMTDSLRRNVAQLERTQAQLVQSEKLASIGEMSAAVAHGLRNPLASLRAAAQLVRRHPDSPAAGETLEAIIEEVDRLDRRISHLLSFSRPAPFNPMPEKVDRLVEGLLPAFSEPLRERRRRASTRAGARPARGPGGPHADGAGAARARLQRAGCHAEGRHPPAGRAGRRWRAAVLGGARRGLRTPAAASPTTCLPSVCEPFFTTREEGTGLGLAIAKRYVEQNGGRLEIRSTPGAGTTVRVRLPTGAAA